jgi:hypothetical protein
MSAFVVNKAHIDALVTAAAEVRNHDSGMRWFAAEGNFARHELTYSDTDRLSEVGMMLWAENVASVEARYPDTLETGDYPGPASFERESAALYRFDRTEVLAPVVILKALDCYEYQSCEHEGWYASEARQFALALRDKMIHALPGYDNGPGWELDEAQVRPQRARFASR